MKRFGIITFAVVLLLGSAAFAVDANKVAVEAVSAEADNIVVPVTLNNGQAMTALEIPLKFNDGVTLVDVKFEGTRSEKFDFRHAKINNDDNTVVLAFIPMVYGEKTDLEPGNGVIANLVFSVDDQKVEEINLEPTTMKNPNHQLMFVYSDGKDIKDIGLEFEGINVALSQVVGSEKPGSFSLGQNAPNPFNPTTTISYDLPQATEVRLQIYNVLGQNVKTLVDDFQEAGAHNVIWNGTDNTGTQVASGIYFYRIEAGSFTDTRKMMMLK